MNARDEIEKLAAKVCGEVLDDDVPLAQRLDALKTLMPMYTILTKTQQGKGPAADEFSFDKFREDLGNGMETGDRTRRRAANG